MFCPSCGKPGIEKDHKFCQHCGWSNDHAQISIDKTQHVESKGQRSDSATVPPKSLIKSLKEMSIAFIVLGVLVTAFFQNTVGGGSGEQVALNPKPSNVSYSNANICKAGIGTIFHFPPNQIHVDSEVNNEIHLSYEKDGTKWVNKCKIQGNQILWGALEGRWRTEDNIRFNIDSTSLELTVIEQFPDGSANQEVYGKQIFQ